MTTQSQSIDQIIQTTLLPEHALDSVIIKFIYAYLETRHSADASKAVGISRYSGNRILAKQDIQECIRNINTSLARTHSFDAGEVLERANEIAQVNPQDVLNGDGTVKDFQLLTPAVARTIKKMKVEEVWTNDENGVSVKTGRVVHIEFWDKLKATELLGKFEGVFKDTVKHEIGMDGNLAAVLLANAEARALEMSKPVIQIESK